MKSRGKAGVLAGWIISAAGLITMLLPWLAGADMMGWGYGTAAMGLFTLITGIITLLLFLHRQRVLSRMAENTGVLARWTYDPADWQRWRDEELTDTRAVPVFGAILGGVFLLIGVVFLAIDPDDMGLMFAIMTGVGVLIAGAAWLSAALRRRAILKDPCEAVITRGGVWYMGQLTDWNGVTSRLTGARVEQTGKRTFFTVEYRQLAGRAARMVRSQVRIPVPEGREEEARELAKKL